MGLASSRAEARQLVGHKHFAVNGRTVNIPSFLVKPGMVITMREGRSALEKFKAIIEANGSRPVPQWLEVNKEKTEAKVVALAKREDIDLPIEETLIVELYSR